MIEHENPPKNAAYPFTVDQHTVSGASTSEALISLAQTCMAKRRGVYQHLVALFKALPVCAQTGNQKRAICALVHWDHRQIYIEPSTISRPPEIEQYHSLIGADPAIANHKPSPDLAVGTISLGERGASGASEYCQSIPQIAWLMACFVGCQHAGGLSPPPRHPWKISAASGRFAPPDEAPRSVPLTRSPE